jgi:uncharacterized membrane protein YcaP (DUF421 family)
MGTLEKLIAADQHTINWWQMSIRAAFVFFAALLLIRAGGKRTFGKMSSFDIVVSVMLGSILSRAVTGNSPLLPTLAASGAVILLHFLLAKIALHSPRMGYLIKGREVRLIKAGEIQWPAMRQCNISKHDLMEAARLEGIAALKDIQNAYLERSGKISVFKD